LETVYVAIHTLSPQRASAADARFMDVEKSGLQNITAACQASGTRRAIYVALNVGGRSPGRAAPRAS